MLFPRGSGLVTPCEPRDALWARNERRDMDYPIHPELKVGNMFPDFELPDQKGESQKLSKLIRGFPTVLIFSRGYY